MVPFGTLIACINVMKGKGNDKNRDVSRSDPCYTSCPDPVEQDHSTGPGLRRPISADPTTRHASCWFGAPMDCLVDIKVAVVHASANEIDVEEMASRLVAQVLTTYAPNGPTARLLLLLATKHWCQPRHASLPRLLRQQLTSKTKYDIPLLGASMARIYCSADNQRPAVEEGAVLAVVCSEDLRFYVGHLDRPYDLDLEQRRHKLEEMVAVITQEKTRRPGLGTSAVCDIFAFLPGYYTDKDGRRQYRDHELSEEVTDAFNRHYTVFGAGAADDVTPHSGFQFANDVRMESGLALALLQSDAQIGSCLAHGFRQVDALCFHVTALGERGDQSSFVKSLDHRPVSEVIPQIIHEHKPLLGDPIFGRRYNSEMTVIKVVQLQEGPNGLLYLTRRLNLGDTLHLLDANVGEMHQACKDALAIALRKANHDQTPGSIPLVLAFACASRFRQYQKLHADWMEVVHSIKQRCPGSVVLAGLSAGEFGTDVRGIATSNNLSISMTCLSNKRNKRALNRQWLTQLHRAVSSVLMQTTPETVMSAALTGAIAAGAEGGQICLVDWTLGRVLGRGVGDWKMADTSKQRWDLVFKDTDRDLSKLTGGRGCPRELREFAFPVYPQTGSEEEFTLMPDIDILPLCAWTKHAFFVPAFEPAKLKLHTKLDLERQCNLQAHLDIPMIGSDGNAIATLQLGFAADIEFDTELIAFFVDYSQKVAAALERSQELGERTATEEITRRGDALMRVVGRPGSPLEQQLREFLIYVRHCLRADYVHIRLRVPGEIDRYQLIAPVGPIATIHKQLREYIDGDAGSCAISTPNGIFTNTRDDTIKTFAKARAITSQEKISDTEMEQWVNDWNQVSSVGAVRLDDEHGKLGAFVVDSYREFFFTDRRQRIVQVAAREVVAIISHYYAIRRTTQHENLARIKEELGQLVINVSSPGADWQPCLDYIRKATASETLIFRYVREGYLEKKWWQSPSNESSSGELVLPEAVIHLLINRKRDYFWYPPAYGVSEGDKAWLKRFSSLYSVPAISADGIVRAILLFINRQASEDLPYAFEDRVERQAAEDIATELAAALAMRSDQHMRDTMKAKLDMARRIAAPALFGSLMMHEMLTPISTISRVVDSLSTEPTDVPLPVLAEILKRQKDRLVAYLRLLKEKPVLGISSEPLKGIVKAALRIVEPEFRKPGIRVHEHNEIDLLVRVDLWAIVGSLVNVLGNALDAVGDSGEIWISTELSQGNSSVIISIRNTGEPPPESIRNELFEIGVSTKRDQSHLGLGLPLSKATIESVGGTIEFHVIDERLCEVRIMLPLADDAGQT